MPSLTSSTITNPTKSSNAPIPDVELHHWKEFGVAPRRVALIKLIAEVISIGAWQSLKRGRGEITHRSSRLHLLVELDRALSTHVT